ncbi:MAG: coproporphyrinogen-III oxidase family protein, partial [Gammaproteobacteria bacterium]
MREPPPLSLYVHFPWCVRKCPYCDFNSHEVRGDLPEQDYLQALLRDLDYERARVPKREVISVFIGGGTPSLLSGEALSALLDGIRGRLRLGAEAEITLESNPGTLTAERLRDYKHAGVNRLSIGVQSLRDPQLASLGRIHSGEEARRAFHAARE